MLLRTRVAVLPIAPPPPADGERAGGDQPGSDVPPPFSLKHVNLAWRDTK